MNTTTRKLKVPRNALQYRAPNNPYASVRAAAAVQAVQDLLPCRASPNDTLTTITQLRKSGTRTRRLKALNEVTARLLIFDDLSGRLSSIGVCHEWFARIVQELGLFERDNLTDYVLRNKKQVLRDVTAAAREFAEKDRRTARSYGQQGA